MLVVQEQHSKRDLTCIGIDANPNLEMASVSSEDRMAPRMEVLSSAAFQNIDGKSMASGYIKGIDVPVDVEHMF